MGFAMYFIYIELSWAMFAGVVVIVISMPINAVASVISKKYQVEHQDDVLTISAIVCNSFPLFTDQANGLEGPKGQNDE